MRAENGRGPLEPFQGAALGSTQTVPQPNTTRAEYIRARVRRELLEPDADPRWLEIEPLVAEAERCAAKARARIAFLRSLLREAAR